MRIGLLAPPWLPVPPLAYGGTEAVIDRLARGFVGAGHEVVLATTRDSTCPVVRVGSLPHSLGVGVSGSEERYVLHAYQDLCECDIVHDHTLYGPQLAARVGDERVVTTNHGEFAGAMLDRYERIADRVPIIAISHSQGAAAPQIPIARVIHHGIDPELYPRGSGAGGYYLFLGRMAPEKGVHRAARVAREAGVRLLIAAKMTEPCELRYFAEQVEPLLGDDVVYVGEALEREKLALLADARALINPIRWGEPFGLVMIEALACGTPVLTYAEGAAPEIVDHGVTGFLCVDEHDMVDHLDLVGGIDRAACRAAVRSRFSTKRMVHDHLELFDQVLRGESPWLASREIALPPSTVPSGQDRSRFEPVVAGSRT
jgi:glycosyltransferase involved in cell wall biosynthesis